MIMCSDRLVIVDDNGKALTIGDKVQYGDIPFIGTLQCDGSWYIKCKAEENGFSGDLYIKSDKKLVSV